MTPTRQHRRTAWLAALALSATAVLAACGSGDAGDGDSDAMTSDPGGAAATEQPGADAQAEALEPDVSDVPDVVAEVNGEEITKEEFVQSYEAQFQQAAMSAQAGGQEVDQDELKQQTADGLVGNELLVQAAEEGDYEAGGQQVDETLEEIATSNGMGSTEELLTALEEQGMSEDEVREEIRKQVLVEALIADRGEVESPSDEELREMYDQIAGQQGGDGGQGGSESGLPPFEEVKPQLEEQARAEQENQAVQALVDELREDADVTIHL